MIFRTTSPPLLSLSPPHTVAHVYVSIVTPSSRHRQLFKSSSSFCMCTPFRHHRHTTMKLDYKSYPLSSALPRNPSQMARAAAMFRRLTAGFDDTGAARGGGEGESESFGNLSDLVASFVEREGVIRGGGGGGEEEEEEMRREESESSCWSDSETTKDKLLDLFRAGCDDDDGGNGVSGDVKRKIRTEVEAAWELIRSNGISEGLKRQLVISLRLKGFDAGLCKSSWDRKSTRPAGAYEYVDVNVEGMRYIVEVSLAGQFEIARPSSHYTSLVDVFPPVFIGRPEELKQVIRLMCAAMKQSLRSAGLLIPPWRRKSYMKAKWFGNHKRATFDEDAGMRRLAVRHESLAEISYRCKDDFTSKTRLRAGHLSEVFGGNRRGV